MAANVARPSKVLIVGGGLGGSVLALALARQSIPSIIFESRDSRQDIGGAITLSPNGARILDQLGVWKDIGKHGCLHDLFTAVENTGAYVGRIQVGSVQQFGYQACRIRRSTLHSMILDAVSQTGQSEIRYGKHLTSIDDNGTTVTATFRDGSSESGDYFVGVDGIHSTVRKLLFGEGTDPIYEDVCSVGGLVPTEDIQSGGRAFPLPAMVFGQNGTVGLFLMGDPTINENLTTWAVTLSVPDRDRAAWQAFLKSGEALDECKKAVRGWGDPIESIVAKATSDSCTIWPQYAVPELPAWHKGRCFLIGVAAHAIPPAGGQGAAQAFEDAYLLSRLFAEEGSIAAFEKERSSRIEHVKLMTKTSKNTRTAGGSWLGYKFKMTAMRILIPIVGNRTAGITYAYDSSKVSLA